MASASSIWRLHRTEQNAQSQQPVKVANLANLQIDVSAPAPELGRPVRWREPVRAQGPETFARDDVAIMSLLSAELPPDQATRFGELRGRERARELVERYAGRMRNSI